MLDRCLAKPPRDAFAPAQLLSVARQVCLALVYLHEHETLGPSAHRDVKPGNVLLESSMEQTGGVRAVLMDFGSTRPARISVNDRAGALRVQERAARECTAPFRAPELFDTPSLCDIDERVDVWSLGCLLFAGDAGGRSPFEDAMGQTGGSLALAVLSGKVTWPARNVAGREKNDEIPDARAFAGRGGVPVAERLAGTAHRAGRCDSNRDVARTIKMTKSSRVDILLKSSLRA